MNSDVRATYWSAFAMIAAGAALPIVTYWYGYPVPKSTNPMGEALVAGLAFYAALVTGSIVSCAGAMLIALQLLFSRGNRKR